MSFLFARRRRFSIAITVGLLSISLHSFAGADPVPPSAHRYNLLLVVVNSLNKFHLPLYGYSNPTTPFLDRFARDAYVFDNLITPVSHTPPVIRELFRATPYDRKFFAETDWSESDIVKMSDYPLGKYLIDQGYVYLHEKLPDDGHHPFVSFMHFWNLHFPYDLFRQRGEHLPPQQKRIYESRLKGLDEITLVQEPTNAESFAVFMDYQIFGVRRTELPIKDDRLWESLLSDLKSTGNSSATEISSALPMKLKKRLSRISSARQMSVDDKQSVVKALNAFVRDPDSVIGKILFGPQTSYNLQGMRIGGVEYNRWDQSFVTNIEKHLYWKHPEPFLRLDGDGRLALLKPLNAHQRALLRQLYREALELMLPALALHHAQHLWVALSPATSLAWQHSPDYQNELDLFRSLYDANLSEVDQRLNDCLEHLRKIGAMENTVVVFMGDHGEALMEHGKMEHGNSCYDEDISPPMIVRVPGRLTWTDRVAPQLRTADVLPTLIDLMGLKAPLQPGPQSGVSFAGVLDGGEPPRLSIYSRSYAASRSIRRSDGWKLLWDMGTKPRELYNWKDDPHEIKNVAGDFPAITAELEEELNLFLYGE